VAGGGIFHSLCRVSGVDGDKIGPGASVFVAGGGVRHPTESAVLTETRLVWGQVFLWPVGVYAILLPFAVLLGFNPTRFTLNIYFG
jgi:hypothetical protein